MPNYMWLKNLQNRLFKKISWLKTKEIAQIQNNPYVWEYFEDMKKMYESSVRKDAIQSSYIESILIYIKTSLEEEQKILLESLEVLNIYKNLPSESKDKFRNELMRVENIYLSKKNIFDYLKNEIIVSNSDEKIVFKNNFYYIIQDINRPAYKELLRILEKIMPDLWIRVEAINISLGLLEKES